MYLTSYCLRNPDIIFHNARNQTHVYLKHLLKFFSIPTYRRAFVGEASNFFMVVTFDQLLVLMSGRKMRIIRWLKYGS
jgi:hypothetical protein